jgi:hypothetical protein
LWKVYPSSCLLMNFDLCLDRSKVQNEVVVLFRQKIRQNKYRRVHSNV